MLKLKDQVMKHAMLFKKIRKTIRNGSATSFRSVHTSLTLSWFASLRNAIVPVLHS